VPKIKRSPQAKQDLREHVLYLVNINPDLAERFIDAAAATFAQLAAMPKMGIRQEFKLPELAGTRRWFVAGFEYYLIFYRPIKGGIEILRVLYGTQNIDAIMNDEDCED
jgi:toxin ParE1/3/4